jgi:hypothetical protein
MQGAVGARTYAFALLSWADTQICRYSPAPKKEILFVAKFLTEKRQLEKTLNRD